MEGLTCERSLMMSRSPTTPKMVWRMAIEVKMARESRPKYL